MSESEDTFFVALAMRLDELGTRGWPSGTSISVITEELEPLMKESACSGVIGRTD